EDAPASLPAQTLPGKDNWYEDRDVCLLILALKQGNIRQAQTCLDAVCKTLAEKYPSIILQRCIWADMANLLLKAAKETGLSLNRKSLHALLMAPDLEGFRRQFSALIDSFSEAAAQCGDQAGDELEAEVVRYIRAELFSPQFTIHRAAERFGLSDRRIGGIVRNATGLTYKEFIIHLRMERAKALLSQEHCNVAQTGESVGYGNIPYFIKTFRNATGYTPGEYKKMFEK
ncbi:MAG TPA: helix-turn-helix transcriptional regulator, partial [Clostridia bacterium]|nr:helix-turn-helix transcriptional regulator [Clostridia bacterium]